MDFQKSKEKQLKMKDNSDIGSWDKEIEELCGKINKKKEYYTTSSCAGRIVLIKSSEDKKPGLFMFRSHDKISFIQLKRELEKARKENNLVYFKQEPAILHVACNDLQAAQLLLDKAKVAGWKNSALCREKGLCVR